jgi:hypothetical protein
MPQKLLTIYRTSGLPVTASTDLGGFVFDQPVKGQVLKAVFRVDFYDRPADGSDGNPLVVVPCDPAASIVTLHSDTAIELNLVLLYVLGVPKVGHIVGILQATNSQPFFQAPLFIDGTLALPGAQPGTPSSYLGSFSALNPSQGGVTSPANVAPITGGANGWENFAFGNRITHLIVNRDLGSGTPLPILTMQRTVPVQTPLTSATGFRRLPGPFSILIDLPTSANPKDLTAIALLDSAANLAFAHGTGQATNWIVQIANFNSGTIADFWEHFVFERYVGALQTVEGLDPISLLPRFLSLAAGQPPTAADNNWTLSLPATSQPSQSIVVPSGPGTLILTGSSNATVDLSFDGFKAWDGNGIQLTAQLASSGVTPNPPYMEFQATAGRSPAPGHVRIGSLDLTPSGAPQVNVCAVGFQNIPALPDFWVPRILELKGSLPLSDVQPGGQDEPADPVATQTIDAIAASQLSDDDSRLFRASFVRGESLVLPVPPLSPSTAPFTVGWQEQCEGQTNQNLTLTISASAAGGNPTDVVVIDPQPFTMARVQLPSLSSTASAITNQVAVFSNSFPEGSGWRIAAGAGSFQMLLPPQGIGEEMIKGQPPVPVTPDRAMQFRLTPGAVAALQTTTQLQRFAEPGWNLRRVLGYPGERAPGASVQSLSFEMLYAMTCSVSAPGLLLAEMFSRLGAFNGLLIDSVTGQLTLSRNSGYNQDQLTHFVQLNEAWARTHGQLLSRLGVLELGDNDTDHDLLLTSGVDYTLRGTAQLRYPAGKQPAGSSAPKQPQDGGLPGGVAWPFDSSNIYEDLWDNPKSTDGLLASPKFTALGASGKQRASFSNGNIIIDSESSIGTLVSVTVTLRGYIGNLRHHAKHVVVYTRSVRASRQFFGEQPALEGRPILRKTSEYVEISQKDRAYPENGDPNAVTGPLLGAEFKSIRINVDSAWGSDHGPGWKVPLWKRRATPADVYPRPHIVLELAIDPAKGAASRKCEIEDPDKLYFYTDPKQPSQNTDDWPLVELIDFANGPRMRTVVEKKAARDLAREPGFGQFTYTVAADAPEINVVAQRTKTPMSSGLTNVMFMRAQPQPGSANDGQAAVARVRDHVHNVLDELERAATTSSKTAKQALTEALTGLGSTADSAVQQFNHDLTLANTLDGTALCDRLAAAAGNLLDRASLALTPQWNSLLSSLTDDFNSVSNPVAAFPEVLKQQLLAKLDTVYTGLVSAMSPLLADLGAVSAAATSLTNFQSSLTTGLQKLQSEITDAALAVDGFRKRCNAFVLRFQADADVVLSDITEAVQILDFVAGVNLSSTISGQVAAVRSAVDSFTAADLSGISAALADTTQNAIAINGVIQQLINGLPAAFSPLTIAVNALQKALGVAAADARSLLSVLASIRDNLRAKIIAVADNADISVYRAQIQSVLSAIRSLDQLLSPAKAVLQQQIRSVCHKVLGSVQNSLTQLGADLLGAQLTNAISALQDNATVQQAIDAMEGFRNQVADTLDNAVQQARTLLDPNGLLPAVNPGLALWRAFGDPPAVPNLGFGITGIDYAPAIGYFFDSPAAVAVSQGLNAAATEASDVVDGLSQLGLTLPTTALLDRLIPDDLTKLNISDLLLNIGGLNLATLFSAVGVPESAANNIHVSHRLDPQTLRASLDISLNFTLAESATLFSIGPATVTIDTCNFEATVHIEGGVGQTVSRTSEGSITGDWHVTIGGLTIVTFVTTTLSFDAGGHLHFSISPERVRLDGALSFLANFLQGLGGKGFSINLLPAGVQCILDLPFPDCSFGAFGITNLRLGALFGLDVSSGLDIQVGASLGRKTAPFTLTIFVLGGAGWFEAGLVYHTQNGTLTADVSIGIMASASISISLGPISGGVYIYFGITTEFHSGGTNAGLTVGILLIVEGRVSLLGFIDVDIMLLLEAEYTSGGGLIGRGQITLSIKICWCFTLNVSASVEYTFGKSSSSAPASSPQAVPAAHPAALAAAALPPLTPPPAPTPTNFAQAAVNRINFLT